jgi:glycerol-3-phosphate dehydrogenase subunit C
MRTGNALTRPLMEKAAGIDRRADLPRYENRTLLARNGEAPVANRDAPAFGKRKVMLFATCIANYNQTSLGSAALAVLARNGVETELTYPGCCGMPKFEQGDLGAVAEAAHATAAALGSAIERGYDVVALVPSCALMLKFEWPLLLPNDQSIKKLAHATYDVSEYVVAIARNEGLAPGMKPLPGGVSFHLACHSRAQNMGPKGAELLRLLPEADVAVIERCSGHGGSWGMMRENFDVALRLGTPVARQAAKNAKAYLASECPLAAAHVAQGMALLDNGAKPPAHAPMHPVELMALSYGLIAEPDRG